MLRLSKKSDYGLIALKHISSRRGGHTVNTREISTKHNLPPDLLAKILQNLSKSGIITSHYGSSGGYKMARDPATVTLKDIVQSIDGPVHFLACKSRNKPCKLIKRCSIRKNLQGFEKRMTDLMISVTLRDI